MSELALDVPERETRRKRAGRMLGRSAELRKHLAAAFGESVQRASQRANGIYPQLDVAYDFIAKLAMYERTNPSPIVADLAVYQAEVGMQDYDTPGLIRELCIRASRMRDAAEVACEVLGILALLQERGVIDV